MIFRTAIATVKSALWYLWSTWSFLCITTSVVSRYNGKHWPRVFSWWTPLNFQEISVGLSSLKMYIACGNDLGHWCISCMSPAGKDLTLLVQKLEYSGITMSRAWLLIPGLLVSPGHHHPWYLLWEMNRSTASRRKDFKYLHLLNIEKWNVNVYFLFLNKFSLIRVKVNIMTSNHWPEHWTADLFLEQNSGNILFMSMYGRLVNLFGPGTAYANK